MVNHVLCWWTMHHKGECWYKMNEWRPVDVSLGSRFRAPELEVPDFLSRFPLRSFSERRNVCILHVKVLLYMKIDMWVVQKHFANIFAGYDVLLFSDLYSVRFHWAGMTTSAWSACYGMIYDGFHTTVRPWLVQAQRLSIVFRPVLHSCAMTACLR